MGEEFPQSDLVYEGLQNHCQLKLHLLCIATPDNPWETEYICVTGNHIMHVTYYIPVDLYTHVYIYTHFLVNTHMPHVEFIVHAPDCHAGVRALCHPFGVHIG